MWFSLTRNTNSTWGQTNTNTTWGQTDIITKFVALGEIVLVYSDMID